MVTRYRDVLMLALLSLVFASCISDDPGRGSTETVGQQDQALWNGTQFPATPSQTSRVVNLQVWSKVGTNPNDAPQRRSFGSGVALNNRWVLTASHVRGKFGSDYADVRAYLAHDTTNVFYAALEGRVIGNPIWTDGGRSEPIYDLEVIKFNPLPIEGTPLDFETPIFHDESGKTKTITQQIVDMGEVECWGYGLGGPSLSWGTLRYGLLPVQAGNHTVTVPGWGTPFEFKPPINFFTTPSSADQQMANGDSGGPCYRTPHYSLVGIMRGNDKNSPDPSSLGVVTSVGAYGNLDRQLERIAKQNPESIYFADLDGDQNPDLVMAVIKTGAFNFKYVGLQAQLTNAPELSLTDGFMDFQLYNLLDPSLPSSALASATHTAGDFNGDGTVDLLMLFPEMQFLYYDGVMGAPPVDHLAACLLDPLSCFEPLSLSYKELRASDFNQDGYDDLEALTADGDIDVYYGSPSGLTTATEMVGWPTADGNDGKFVTQTGAGLWTPEQSVVEVYVFPRSESFSIDVFDGDFGGMNDRFALNVIEDTPPWDAPTDVVCYSVAACDWQYICDNVQAPKSSFDFADADNAWKELHSNSWFPQQYAYRIRAVAGTCQGASCQNPCDADGNPPSAFGAAKQNLFKLRANGTHIGSYGPWSFMGLDSAGPYATYQDGDQIPDTTYDGRFNFPIWVGDTSPDEVCISDSDADFEDDGKLDPSDPIKSPGVGAGKSGDIRFTILWYNETEDRFESQFPVAPPVPTLPGDWRELNDDPDPKKQWWWYLDPSGNYNLNGERVERHSITNDHNKPGYWNWVWDRVKAKNNIRIDAYLDACSKLNAKTSPTFFLMSRSTLPPPSPSIAKPITLWRTDLSQATKLLPVMLGSNTQVSDAKLLELLLAEAGVNALPTQDSSKAWANALAHGKITLCHQPIGSEPALMTVAERSVASHLAHGDSLSATNVMGTLLAELLVTKLNVKLTLARGEDLPSAMLYGRSETVAEILAESDAAVDDIDNLCKLDVSQIERIEWLIRRLRAINAGDVSYSPLPPPSPQTSARAVMLKPALTLLPPGWPFVGL